MTTLDNGDIVFPRRGKPPPDFANFTRDPNDPFLFHAKFIECKHRIFLNQVLPCGKINGKWHCQLKGVTVSVPFCAGCDVKDKI